ncbi:hypothetical protein [Actinacidiphila guanduensis]|uniref:Uncharacterized protein n=1 Tax=Actinacidiphila guanduensis TaxID=310781 RepID=A0A1H0KET9_9ACTN|nr:hypothetical protein [Actinacidiphila guanduensis]SDO54313.1 hypothetical protein SAMN05216259_110220 [Actinacidiphila guanduensis]
MTDTTSTGTSTGNSAGASAGASTAPAPSGTSAAPAEPAAGCVLCGKPTEYPNSTKGVTLCPVCEWQEAQRLSCSG